MPIRELVASDAGSIVSCINSFFSYLRPRGALPELVTDWTTATLTGFRAAGYEAWGYVTPSGRVDAVCIFGLENHDRGAGPEKWMAVKILVVRASVVTEANHEKYTLRALKLAIPRAVTAWGVVGVMCEYAAAWDRLTTFLDTWPGAGNVAEVSPNGGIARRWIRVQPGLPDLTVRAAAAGE